MNSVHSKEVCPLQNNNEKKYTRPGFLFIFLIVSIFTAILIKFSPLKVTQTRVKPTYAIYCKGESRSHLVHVSNILKLLGFEQVNINENWNLLWAHDYPFFELKQQLMTLKPHQAVNHFPGCGFLTNKVDLSTTPLPFLPRAFRWPQDKDKFIKYSSYRPKTLFVEKHNEHREIYIKPVADISLDSNTTFLQEYIDNPFLIDGYKFDVGVYVVVTSIDPLRIYIYTGDVLLRFCTKLYYPLDFNETEKYVVGDNYMPVWKVPSLIKYFHDFGGNMRAAFDAYLQDQSEDPFKVWQQVEDIIRTTVLSKENNIAQFTRIYKSTNFFDLMRFDFILDERLRVYLMEVNMSPNLSSAHYAENSVLYEQILYSTLQLVGIGTVSRQKGEVTENIQPDSKYCQGTHFPKNIMFLFIRHFEKENMGEGISNFDFDSQICLHDDLFCNLKGEILVKVEINQAKYKKCAP